VRKRVLDRCGERALDRCRSEAGCCPAALEEWWYEPERFGR